MKEIELTQGYTAIVDDEDYERVSQYNWCAGKACINSTISRNTVKLSRFILGIADVKQEVGYINGDYLDNRKSNLRLMTRSEINQKAGKKRPGGKCSSEFKGVSWDKSKERWKAQICVNRKNQYVGRFDDEVDAALAYDSMARKLFGDAAYLNFPDQPPDRIEHSSLPVRSGVRKGKGIATTSQFKGVSYSSYVGWRATFTINGERITRYAKSEMEAAQIYDELILKHLGSNARSNFESIWAWKRRESANVKSAL